MRKLASVLCLLLIATAVMAASVTTNSDNSIPQFPGTLRNARYVYVTSYDGNEFNPNLLPEDRDAIINVQDALKQWGKYVVVYRPQDADMILVVQSRGSEDLLAVYDPQMPGTYLWRVMGRNGLQKGETPLVSQLKTAVEQASKKS